MKVSQDSISCALGIVSLCRPVNSKGLAEAVGNIDSYYRVSGLVRSARGAM